MCGSCSTLEKMTVFNLVLHDLVFPFRGICYLVRKRTKGMDYGERAKGRMVNLKSHFRASLVAQ